MAKGFFVTGTDTGVGKTIITAALIRAAHILGFRACGMKPIETGCKTAGSRQQAVVSSKGKTLIPSDGMFLLDIAGTNESIDLITPIRFENPLAPMPASEIEGIPVDLTKIKNAYLDLTKKYDVIVIEGIGGLLVPINREYFVLDLARDFGLPLIVVSRPGLGAINHSMLTVNYALKEGLSVAGIIMNYTHTPEGDLAEKTNPEVIKQISPVPIIGTFPYLKDLESSTIEKAVIKNLDIELIRSLLQSQ
jgi:dethiobiotin synthetase